MAKSESTKKAAPVLSGWAAVEAGLQASSSAAAALAGAEGASKHVKQYAGRVCVANAATGKVVREAIASDKAAAEAAKEHEALLERRKKIQEG